MASPWSLLVVVIVSLASTSSALATGATSSSGGRVHWPLYIASPVVTPPEGISFNASFGDSMVLQQAPAKACLYGVINDPDATGATVNVTQSSSNYQTSAVAVTRKGLSPGILLWKACLNPYAPPVYSAEFTVTATCTGCSGGAKTASISKVLFGEVWYCGGQSNMALPLMHTLSRNISRDAILKGAYSNIRLHGVKGNMNPDQVWTTLKDAIATNADSDLSTFGQYSSTCYYFGESLYEELAKVHGVPVTSADVPAIGLVHTSYGGSTIEQWLTNKTIATCGGAYLSKQNQEWHDQRVMPYADMTIKGWVWYQAENDMHNLFGNAALGTGYSCLMKALVQEWRSIWSQEPGTTAPDAPFGFVTLAPSGTEGGSDIGTMRWAQTASEGMAPSPGLPNTFMAQAFDLNDPYRNITCYNRLKCAGNTVPPPGGWGHGCDGYCESVRTTNWYMGPIHPRSKKPVGQRLAQAGVVVAYKAKGWANGPTLAGCTVHGANITIRFNPTMLGNETVKVGPYYVPDASHLKGAVGSKMDVLVNQSSFCMQQLKTDCRDDGTGKSFPGPIRASVWVPVDIMPGSKANEVVVDLTRANVTADGVFGIRYGWVGDCCSEVPSTSSACPLASCPLMGSLSGLPANQFIAHITGRTCQCIAPQQCNN